MATCGRTSTRARDEHADRVALVLGDRRVTLRELRRAAVGVSHRLAEARRRSPATSSSCSGRHSIEAAVAMLGCLHRGVVLAPLPPMFNETQLSALIEQTDAQARSSSFGGEKEIAQVPRRWRRPGAAAELLPEDVDAVAARTLPDERERARRRRGRGRPALVGHDVGAQGHRALDQHAALRDRGRLRALGPDRRRHLPHRRRVRLRRRARLRLPARAAQRRHRRPAQTAGTPRRRCG